MAEKIIADLHIHTNFSDGQFSPEKIIDIALEKSMKTIAITDHDTTLSLEKAIKYAKGKPINLIPGVEISCYDSEFKNNVHILGMFINPRNKEITSALGKTKNSEIIMRIKKFFSKFSSASKLKIWYMKKFSLSKKIPMETAISSIKSAGGISIIAHPGIYLNDMKKIINKFVSLGGQGIEVYYPYEKVYNFSQVLSDKIRRLSLKIANDKKVIVSGGSDFHGNKRNVMIGECGLNEAELNNLLSYSKPSIAT
jgi:3',5'-nucleoside bisphosphate phosphatase